MFGQALKANNMWHLIILQQFFQTFILTMIYVCLNTYIVGNPCFVYHHRLLGVKLEKVNLVYSYQHNMFPF